MTGERDEGAVAAAAQQRLFLLLLPVYLGGGVLNAAINLLVPGLRMTLSLDYAQALSVHVAYYSSYLLFALPCALIAGRIGHMRSIAIGLAVIAVACSGFAVALQGQRFAGVLLMLLLMATGATFLQVSGNAVPAAFGSGPRMASRFTLLQAFNSLGTVIGPLVGTWLLLGEERPHLVPFLVVSALYLVGSAAFVRYRDLIARTEVATTPPWRRLFALVRTRRMLGGVAAIFAYVGAEVTIGTLAVSYLMLPETAGLAPERAGRWVSLYWLGAMLGRFAGSPLVLRFGARRPLMAACAGAAALLAFALLNEGMAGAAAILAIGLCNSVMFPLTYAMALPDRAEDVPLAAMLLCMAVVGGAVIAILTGLLADRVGLIGSLALPGFCYLIVLAFAYSRAMPAPAANPA